MLLAGSPFQALMEWQWPRLLIDPTQNPDHRGSTRCHTRFHQQRRQHLVVDTGGSTFRTGGRVDPSPVPVWHKAGLGVISTRPRTRSEPGGLLTGCGAPCAGLWLNSGISSAASLSRSSSCTYDGVRFLPREPVPPCSSTCPRGCGLDWYRWITAQWVSSGGPVRGPTSPSSIGWGSFLRTGWPFTGAVGPSQVLNFMTRLRYALVLDVCAYLWGSPSVPSVSAPPGPACSQFSVGVHCGRSSCNTPNPIHARGCARPALTTGTMPVWLPSQWTETEWRASADNGAASTTGGGPTRCIRAGRCWPACRAGQ